MYIYPHTIPENQGSFLQIRNISHEIRDTLRQTGIGALCWHLCRGFFPPTSFNALLSTSHFNLAPKSSFPFPFFPLGIPRGRICSRSSRINPLQLGPWTKRLHKLRESLDRDTGFKAFPGSLGQREGLLCQRVFPCGFQHTHNFWERGPRALLQRGTVLIVTGFDSEQPEIIYFPSASLPPHIPSRD